MQMLRMARPRRQKFFSTARGLRGSLHSEVITRLPGVERVQSTLTLRTVKRTTRLPLRE